MQRTSSLLTKTTAMVCALAVLSFAAKPPAAKAPTQPAAGSVVLDQKEIHSAYNEGDFDKVISLIEVFNRANKSSSRADSIFVAKHLAVVYSANPQHREKGRYYMYRLLEMLPSAELVDMFVSDEIDRIFDKVRKEFLVRQSGFGVDSTQISMPDKASTGSAASASAQQPAPAAKSSSSGGSFWKRNAFWIAGGAGVVIAGAAAAYILLSDDPTPQGKSIVIPAQTTMVLNKATSRIP